MPGHDTIVVGFSAGGVDPHLQLVADLPPDLPASVFVVHHFPAQSVIPSLVSRGGPSIASPVRQALESPAEPVEAESDQQAVGAARS